MTVTLKNAAGAAVATDTGLVLPLFIDPGGDALFEAYFDDPPAFSSFDVSISACDTASALLLQFFFRVEMTTIASSVTSAGGLTVSGTARNDASEETSAVAFVAIYGVDGNILRIASGDVSPDPLAAGATGSFSVPLPESNGLTASSHRVWYGP
ncbi:MAG: hypothetical protein AB7T37_15490 [Dehalococcoidia bacterium]